MQRKVAIGASNDAYERQADQVANRVASGGRIAPGSISSIAPGALGQRQSKDEKKKGPASAPPVQREVKPEDKTKDARAAMPVQKQAKPDDKQDKKAAPVQRETKAKDRKQDSDAKAPAVQRAGKDDKEKREEKKLEDKLPPAVQRKVRPEDKKKIERDWSAPLQMKSKPEEKDKTAPLSPVQRESKSKEDEKNDLSAAAPIQRADKPEEKKKDEKPAAPAPLQKQAKPEQKNNKKEDSPGAAPVQRAETNQVPRHEEKPVQTSRGGGGATAAPSMESAASHAIASKGPGVPINSGTRGTLESGMETDLSDVRVHSDTRAHEASEALNARAFTHQNDIWLGRGESQSDTRLMAHEAAHVVQQTGSVHRQLVQRDDKPAAAGSKNTGETTAAPASGWDYEGKEGKVQKDKKLVLPLLRVPDFKKPPITPSSLTLPQKTDEPRPDTQRTIWEKDVKAGSAIDTKLNKKIADEKAPSLQKNGEPNYFLQLKGQDIYLIGSKDTLKQGLLRPYWEPSGRPNSFQVDHKQELQLGGTNSIENMWLLDADANMSSGRNIKAERDSRIQTLLNAAIKKGVWKEPPDVEAVRRGYTIEVEKVMGGLDVGGKPDSRWTREAIKDAALQLDGLKCLTKDQINKKGLQGTASRIVIYTNPAGGGVRYSEGWQDGQTERKQDFHFGKMFQITKVNYDRNSKQGSVEGNVFRGSHFFQEVKLPPIPLQEMDVVDYGGFISVSALTRTIQHELKLKGLSAVQIDEAQLTDRGLVARGKVQPSIRPFDKVSLDLIIDGDNIYLSKVFSADDFNFPGPIKATSASLEIFAGTQGVGVRGDVHIEIERLGKGKITAGVSTSEGPKIEGDFEFDTDLFDPAKVHVEYFQGRFSGGGKIGVKPGKVRGIKSASIDASFTEDVIDAKGSIMPDIPAVEQADLAMHYDEKSGLTIAGDLQLKKDIPGLADGSIHAEVNKKDDKYLVKAHGEATPKIPGITSKLMVTYDDGAFDAIVIAGYEKGMLKGSVIAGATNRPVDDSGKPGEVSPAKADKITLYGGGSVTLQLAPWLQATAVIKFKPDGDVQVTGKIGLPSVLDIFDEKRIDKNIFKIGIYIPIVPGVALNVGGGVDLSAGIGPGQLQEVEVDVTYDPAKEDETNVHGHAALHIPAHAGLRMNVHAALDVGVPLADVEGGIELGGTLGIAGALHAGVDIDWTPKKGLVLDASAEIYGEPKFRFDITGYVKVEVGVGPLSETLWEKRWELAAIEYGSGLRLGLKLPVHYQEGKPFNVSLSDIQFEVPNVDPMSVLKGLIDQIT
ncbi:DUF4157 domain-containing protein [Edaphobacter aggregans]|uniref:eCIS core domain-containing protein n=1 Tax=Edaphobacter aggregans TaxID=570835 RepID=UPI0016395440|nr:DUF4157 domain-containing protein [Edaphobacter aggregans]